MSTKKASQAPSKKSGKEKSETPMTGRVHTIAKGRTKPVTRSPKEAPVAVIVSTEESLKTAETSAKTTDGVLNPARGATPAPSDDTPNLCVFAFRLTPAERDEIHKAAGPGKASRFVKAVALAVARLDDKAIQEATDEVAVRINAAHCK
jgi:hypothetical protein